MTTRQLWKESPDFRRSMRNLIIWGTGGLLVGIAWGLIGKQLPAMWSAVWSLGFCGAVLVVALYMAWDLRRMEKERLEMMRAIQIAQRAGKHAVEDVLRILAELPNVSEETRGKARETLKDGGLWLN